MLPFRRPAPLPTRTADSKGRFAIRSESASIALLAAWLFSGGVAEAQTPNREPAVVELLPGARALALGMAPQLGSDDPDLAFVHPALVQELGGVRGGYTRFGSTAAAYTLSTASDWFGGGVALSVHALEYGRPAGSSPGDRSRGLDDLIGEADAGRAVGEMAASATYGRTIARIRFGVSGRLFTQRHGGERISGQAIDLGLATQAGPVRVALSGRNLGNADLLPSEVVLGAGAYGRPLGPLDVGGAVQLRYRDDGQLEYGGGVEFGYWPVRGRTFVARVGLRNIPDGEASPLTFGGSFWGDALVLDYAFQPMDGLDGIHRVGLGWR